MHEALKYIIILVAGLMLIIYSLADNTERKKKETPTTIYTPKDIYYVYKDSIVSESGLRVVDFKAAYIELQTACDLH